MSRIVRRRRFLRWRIPRAALALAAVGAALSVPTSAVAGGPDVICVHVTCAPGIPSMGDNLQEAFLLASALDVPTKIMLGDKGSPYVGAFTYTPANPATDSLTIQGVGATRPVLTGPVGATILAGPSVTVQGVDFEMPDAAEGLAMDLTDGTLSGVTVTGPQPVVSPGGSAVVLAGTSSLSNVQISGRFDPPLQIDGNATATNLRIDGADEGIGVSSGTSLVLTDSRVQGRFSAISPVGAVNVGTSTLVTTDPGSKAIFDAQDDVRLDHVTIAHEGASNGQDTALDLHAAAGAPSAVLHAIAIAGFPHGITRTVAAGKTFPVAVSDSVWDASGDSLGGTAAGSFTESNDAHVAPALVDLAGGDLRPRGSSAQIDRDVQTPAASYSDILGIPAIDGNGDGVARPDAGALEYRHQAPVIESVSVPGSGTTGAPLPFAATTADADGDHVTVTWDFGDRTVTSGASATHTFAGAGARVVTLTATDEAGLTDRRTFPLTVATGGTTGAGGTGAGGTGSVGAPGTQPPTGDHVPPTLSRVRLSSNRVRVTNARTLHLRFRVSEAATIRVSASRAIGTRVLGARRAIVVRLGAGQHSLALLSSLRRLHLLRPGRVTLTLSAVDAAGNRSSTRSVTLTLRA